MPSALALHDAMTRSAVERHHGLVVKMTGDGVHAAFDDPLDALNAVLELQRALSAPDATAGIALKVRCGLHTGINERRDRDFFGVAVNRAARIMNAAHGGQVLLSETVAVLVRERLPVQTTLRDLGSVRLRDLAQSEHVYQLAHPTLRGDFPALRSLEATPNNLIQQLTSFVGREHELAEVMSLLQKTRLLTLTGAGGIGKTRLSLQAAAAVMDDYPDGVWFIELAPVADAQRVPQAVASVLGVKEEAGRSVQEALAKFVSDRQLLLVLDNCEHVLLACAELAKQLLLTGRQLKILASSRERMHVAGETSYSVPTLSIPDPGEAVSLAALTDYESVRLFVERAAAAQSEFAMNERNAPAVIDICRRLDGIPLAIELAAARVRVMSVEMIAARLGDRFRLLASGDRTTLPRQQTLRALIDWSHDLLAERERAVLRRLAVFSGGWTMDAAEAVATADDVEPSEALNLLGELVEKSLVELDSTGGRYRLLDTVRQYAQERLDLSDDGAAAHSAHLAYFLALAERATQALVGREQGLWLTRLDLERENILAAHAWCDHAPDGAELGLRLVSAIKRYWLNRGLMELGYRVTLEALARAGAQKRNAARCRGLFDSGQVGYFMGLYAEARKYLEESLDIARELGDTAMGAMVLQPLGMACLGQGDTVHAQRYLEEALALAEQLGDRRQLAAALNVLGQFHRLEGELDKAEPLYQKVVMLARQLGDRESVAIGLLNLAMASIGRGNAGSVDQMLLEVLSIAADIGSKPAGQSVLEVSSGLASLRQDWARAALFFGMAEKQATSTGLHRDPADEAFLAPLIAAARDAMGTAAFSSAETSGRARSYDEAITQARDWLARAR